ncbi:hypothetical protein AOLI_G00135460 [Acnodon oligacanthus]
MILSYSQSEPLLLGNDAGVREGLQDPSLNNGQAFTSREATHSVSVPRCHALPAGRPDRDHQKRTESGEAQAASPGPASPVILSSPPFPYRDTPHARF